MEGGKNIFGVRDDITNPWKTEKEIVVQGLVGAVGREGHGQVSQHMGSDRIFLLDTPPKVFGPTSKSKLKGKVLGRRRNINIHKKLVVPPDG